MSPVDVTDDWSMPQDVDVYGALEIHPGAPLLACRAALLRIRCMYGKDSPKYRAAYAAYMLLRETPRGGSSQEPTDRTTTGQ
jgi:hypothetical protein